MGSVLSTINYTYGDSSWGDLLTKWNGHDITYDAVGNVLSDRDSVFTWEHGRELTSMTAVGFLWQFSYDQNGMRTSRTNGTRVYNYVYNGDSLSQVLVDNHDIDFTYDASGRPLSLIFDGTAYWYDLNLQGDVVGILDSYGNTVVSYTYNAWGCILSITGSEKDTVGFYNPLRYRGYVWDPETGLYYLQSRYYSPGLGRFINADVLYSTGQGPLGNNMFAYCNNNPVNYSDPAGLCALHMTNKLDNRFSNITMCGCSGGSGSSYYQESASGGVINDTLEFIFNTDEQAVLDAEYFAFYNGVPVVKLPIGTNAFSFFVIFLGDDVKNRVDPVSTVRHEYGHSRHFRMIGPLNYASTVFLPSVLGFHFGSDEYHSNYYSHGYEYIANVLGDAYNDMIYPESTDKWGLAYFLYTLILPK